MGLDNETGTIAATRAGLTYSSKRGTEARMRDDAVRGAGERNAVVTMHITDCQICLLEAAWQAVADVQPGVRE